MQSTTFSQLSRRVVIVQLCNGLAFGLYLFTYGPWFLDAFQSVAHAARAMMFTSLLLGVRQGGVALLEAPTGALADAFGRARAVRWSWACRIGFFLGLALLHRFHTMPAVLLCSVLACLAYSASFALFNGAFAAWVVDSCRAIAPDQPYGPLLSRGHSMNQWGQLIGGVVSVLCFIHGVPAWSFIVGAVVCVSALLYCQRMLHESHALAPATGRTTWHAMVRRSQIVLGASSQVIRGLPELMALVAVFATMMFLSNVVDYFWPIALRAELGIHLPQYWWLAFVVALGTTRIGGAQWVRTVLGRCARWHRTQQATILRRLLVGIALLQVSAVILQSTLAFAHRDSLASLAVVVFITALAYGFLVPCYETLMNLYIPACHAHLRATLLSFGSLVRSGLLLLLAIPSGGHTSSSTCTGWIIPALFLLVATLWANTVLRRSEHAPTTTRCAAQQDAAT